jgi:hypothetical protein
MLRNYTTALLLALALNTLAQNDNARVRALIQSSIPNESNGNVNCGTYQSMEAIRKGAIPGLKGVNVRLDQPVCAEQNGSVFLQNETGEQWTYKLIDRNGPLITEGAMGYNRQIGNLRPGSYLIQFVHSNGTSVIDQFTIREGKKLNLDLSVSSKTMNNINSVQFTATPMEGMEYEWYFGDGQMSFEANTVVHTFNEPGNYMIKCLVSNFDCKAEKTIAITIQGPAVLAEQKD